MIYKFSYFKIVVILILFISIFLPNFGSTVKATGLPFGGTIVDVMYCTCSGNFLINYTPALASMPIPLSYRPGASILYQFGQILKPGSKILGLTDVVDPCSTGHHCSVNILANRIQMVGTSM